MLLQVRLLAHLQHPNVLLLKELFLDGPDFQEPFLLSELEALDILRPSQDVYLCLERPEPHALLALLVSAFPVAVPWRMDGDLHQLIHGSKQYLSDRQATDPVLRGRVKAWQFAEFLGSWFPSWSKCGGTDSSWGITSSGLPCL